MSVENGDPDRRRSAPVPAWEQRGPQGAPPPGYRQPPRHGAGPAPQAVRPGPPPGNQPPTNRIAPPVPNQWPGQGGPYSPAPGQSAAGQAGPPQPPLQQPPLRRPPPQASPAPLSGPAAGIGAPSNGDGNAYSQTTDPADSRHDDYSVNYLDDYDEDQDSGAQMTPAPTSRANKTNPLSVVALILSIIGVTFVFGIICGHVARSQIRQTREQGASFAIAALWVGYLYLAATVLVLAGYFYIVGTGD